MSVTAPGAGSKFGTYGAAGDDQWPGSVPGFWNGTTFVPVPTQVALDASVVATTAQAVLTVARLTAMLSGSILDATGTAIAPLYAVVNASAAGAGNLLVAATAGKRIRVLSYAFVSTGVNAINFLDGATAISGAMAFAANGGISAASGSAYGLLQTTAGNALNLQLSTAAQVSGHLVYVLV